MATIFITTDEGRAEEARRAIPGVVVHAPGNARYRGTGDAVVLDGQLDPALAFWHWRSPRLAVACWTDQERARWAGIFWSIVEDHEEGARVVDAPADLGVIAEWLAVPAQFG